MALKKLPTELLHHEYTIGFTCILVGSLEFTSEDAILVAPL